MDKQNFERRNNVLNKVYLPITNPPGENDGILLRSIVRKTMGKNNRLVEIIVTKQMVEISDVEQELFYHGWKNLQTISKQNKTLSSSAMYNFLRLRLYEIAKSVRSMASSRRDIIGKRYRIDLAVVAQNVDPDDTEQFITNFEAITYKIPRDQIEANIEINLTINEAYEVLNDREKVIISFAVQGMSFNEMIRLGLCTRREIKKIFNKIRDSIKDF